MNTADAQQMVVGALAGTAVIAASAALAQGDKPSPRMLVGFAGAGFGLGVTALFAPKLAASVALLVLTSTVFVTGGPLWDAVSRITK